MCIYIYSANSFSPNKLHQAARAARCSPLLGPCHMSEWLGSPANAMRIRGRPGEIRLNRYSLPIYVGNIQTTLVTFRFVYIYDIL